MELSPAQHHRRRGAVNSAEDPHGSSADSNEYQIMMSDGVMKEQVAADSHLRSLVKGLTWRFLATTTTTIIAWMITGEIGHALRIGFFEFFAKLAIYYAHERIWTRIRL